LFPLFATGVVYNGGKFAPGVVDTGGNLPMVWLAPVANLLPVSLTPVANLPVPTTLAEMVVKFAIGVGDTVVHLDLLISLQIFEKV
jgi:hypothetical protein